jgi:hypothetical protein
MIGWKRISVDSLYIEVVGVKKMLSSEPQNGVSSGHERMIEIAQIVLRVLQGCDGGVPTATRSVCGRIRAGLGVSYG